MRSEELADALEQLADGPPWDTAWLRSLLPELAVRGRLVAQEEGDGTSLTALQCDRTDWSAKAAPRGLRDLGEQVEPNENWFSIPSTWEWARLPWVTKNLGQEVPNQVFLYVDISAVDGDAGVIQWAEVDEVPPQDAPSRARKRLAPGCVIYSSVRPYQRKIAIFDPPTRQCCIASTGFQVLSPRSAVSTGFLWAWLRSDHFDRFAALHAKGAAYPAINDRDFSKALIPLPPLAEQHRIVAKVDELMEHAAVVEERHLAATSARVRLRDAALHALAEAEDHEAVETAWSRIEEHFDDLFTEPEDIQPLRQTILQLAVRGRLVAQEEGPVAQSIRASVSIIGGSTPSKSRADYWDGSIPWVSPKDMKVRVIEDSKDHISPLALEERTQKTVPEGSVLIVIRGMILAHSFPVAVTAREVTINQDMKALVPDKCVVSEWLAFALRGSKFEVLSRVERSTHGTCKLALAEVLDLPISVPPLAEQHRIVAKVDELMALCDTLETSLTRAKATREQFAGSISHALAQTQ